MSNIVKSSLFTFLQAFVGVFIVALTGWLQDILNWVSDLGDGGEAVVAFPDPNVLIKAAASAVIAGIIAVVTAAHTAIRNRGVLGEPPVYPDTKVVQ